MNYWISRGRGGGGTALPQFLEAPPFSGNLQGRFRPRVPVQNRMKRASETDSKSASPNAEALTASFIIYVSIATQRFPEKELVDLLTVSRKNNSKAGITGILLYKEQKFMQLLEGEKAAVNRIFETIRRDPRHHDVIPLSSGEQEGRAFAEFSMAFQDLHDPSVQELPGYSEYLDRPLSADAFSDDPTSAQRLLQIFKRTGLWL